MLTHAHTCSHMLTGEKLSSYIPGVRERQGRQGMHANIHTHVKRQLSTSLPAEN